MSVTARARSAEKRSRRSKERTQSKASPTQGTGNPTNGHRPPSRDRRNIEIRQAYLDCSEITGPPVAPPREQYPVAFRSVLRPMAKLVLTFFVLVNCATSITFIGWLLLPAHVPGALGIGTGGWPLAVSRTPPRPTPGTPRGAGALPAPIGAGSAPM